MFICGIFFPLNAFLLCCDKVGLVHRRALFGKRPSPYYGKNSSNKQREMTVHYFKTWRSVNRKMSRTLKVSSSAVAKTLKRYDETGAHEDRHRKGRPRVNSAAEDKFIRVNSSLGCRPNKSRVKVTDTSQHQLFRGDCLNQAFMVELL